MSIESFGRAVCDHLDRDSKCSTQTLRSAALDPNAPVLDAGRVQELLGIAGPIAAAELMERLKSDLSNVGIGLGQAVGSSLDIDAIRAETHVLISLAGAIGATPLYNLATTLNAAAHRDDNDSIRSLCADTTIMVNVVIEKLNETVEMMDDGA